MAKVNDRAEDLRESEAAGVGADPVVKIRGLSSEGAGVGNLADGRVVFVPRTAPGDEVEAHITSSKRRWAKGQLRELIVSSPDRVPSACPYYAECGGCSVQHIAYEKQLHWKAETVREALRRIAHLDVGLPEIVPSPNQRDYRSRVTFTLIRLPGGRVIAGFHRLDTPNRIVDIEDGCILPEPAVAAAWTGLRAAWGESARSLPSGTKLRLTLRAVDEGVILFVEGGRGPGRPDILLREVEGLVAVWAARPGGGGKLLAGLTHVHDTRFGETLRTGPTTFLQVNRKASEPLYRWVLEQGAVSSTDRVVDAYCGVGFFGREMARCGADVLGIERDRTAAKSAARDAPEGFDVWTGAVEDRLAEALPADLVVLNPPRGGVEARVTEVLQEAGPETLIYVSCDPATLARDIGRLSSTYDVVDVRAFDLFPQTAHVEVVVVLKRGTAEIEEEPTSPKRIGPAAPLVRPYYPPGLG
jgi:23S rRNA (uracil1939-C5)-methyltransferase